MEDKITKEEFEYLMENFGVFEGEQEIPEDF